MRHQTVSKWNTVCLVVLTAAGLSLTPVEAGAFGTGHKEQAAIDIKDPLTATARFQPSIVEPGGTMDLVIDLDLHPGFHAYADRFKIVFETPDDLKLDKYRAAPLVQFKDSVTKSMKDGVQGKSSLRTHIEVPLGFKPGQYDTQIKLTYQACTDEFCLFPKTLALRAPLEIRGALKTEPTPTTAPRVGVPQDNSAIQLRAALDEGLFSALLLMFVVGFLTSLTPCIYPMIPITLAVLGVRAPKNGAKPSTLRSFSIAVVYVLGIALTYSTLGVIAASTGGLFGAALSNIYVVTALALVFVAMGLSMFGLFEVQPPAFIRNRLGAAGPSQGGFAGAFVTGLIAGIVASPCIGPVLVSVLAFIAQTQNKTLGFVLLFTFALGMGMLFIVLGLSGNLLTRLPRAGSWMESVKYLFGTVMIGMAFYYIEPLYPKWLFLSLMGVAGVLLASYYGAFDPITAENGTAQKLKKGVLLATFFFGVAFATAGLMMRFGILGTNGLSLAAPGPTPSSTAPVWKDFSPAAFDEAIASGKPVVIDFMAEWCGACKELEELTYPKPQVAALLEKFVLLKVDATENTPTIEQYTTKYNVVGLPTLLFYNSKGELVSDQTLTGFENADAFAKRLEAVLR